MRKIISNFFFLGFQNRNLEITKSNDDYAGTSEKDTEAN
jgi:hypothetical protein